MDLYKNLEDTNKLLTAEIEKAKQEETLRRQMEGGDGIPELAQMGETPEFEDAYRTNASNANLIRVLEEQKVKLEDAIRASLLNQTRDWDIKNGVHRLEHDHLRDKRGKGLFGRMGLWFKRHFSSSYNQPRESEPVQVEEVTHSSRFILEEERINELRTQDAAWQEQSEIEYREEKKILDEEYGGKMPTSIRRDAVVEDMEFEKIASLYTENGWELKGNQAPKEIEDEQKRNSQIKIQLCAFIRELGGDDIDQEYSSVLESGVYHYKNKAMPLADVIDLLEHRDDEHAEKFMKDVLDFSLADMYKKYSFHTMSAKERIEIYPKLDDIGWRVNALCQFAQKFFPSFVSPELMGRIQKAAYEVSLFNNMLSMIGKKMGSYEEYHEKVIGKCDYCFEYGQYAEEYKNIRTPLQEGKGIVIENTIISDCLTIEDIKSYAEELTNYRLLTETGRPRLMGNEPAEIIRKFAAEDYRFYSDLRNKGKTLVEYMKKHRAECKEALPENITQKIIEESTDKIGNLIFAFDQRLARNSDQNFLGIEKNAGILNGDKYWYLDKMNKDAEDMKLTKVGFEGQQSKYTDEMLEERARVLRIVGPQPRLLYDEYSRIQGKIKNGESLSIPEKATVRICKLYVTLVQGPADLYKRLRAEIGDDFGAEEIKLGIELCEHEILQANSVRDNKEYIDRHKLDRRVMSVCAPSYRTKADGTPYGPADEQEKQRATEFIQKYQEDRDFRLNFVKTTIEESLAMPFTMEMLTTEYISAHFAEIRIISERNTIIDNLIKDPRNKEYFSKLTDEEMSKLLDITSGLGTALGHVLKVYSCKHSFIAGNGMDILDKECQTMFVQSNTPEYIESIMTEMASVIEKRKQGFKLPDVD